MDRADPGRTRERRIRFVIGGNAMTAPPVTPQRLLEVLRPEHGIARSVQSIHDDDLGLWGAAIDIGLGSSRASVAGAGIVHVGAGGFQRADTMIRGAGEAVERYALMPPVEEVGRELVSPRDPRRTAVDWRRAGRVTPASDALPVECLPGEILGGATGLMVPTCLIDDPAGPAQLAEATPSGAAAGSSFTSAACSALLESVERDAVQAFWALRPNLGYLDHERARQCVQQVRPDGRGLIRALNGTGLRLRCVLIPSDIAGLTVVLAFLSDAQGSGMVAAGSAIGSDVSVTAARAGREAVQVLSLLRALRRTAGPAWDLDSRPSLVTDELSRARFWSEPGAAQKLDEVLSRCSPVDRPAPSSPAATLSTSALAGTLLQQGLQPVIVNVSHRLSERTRQLSWHAVKAVVAGHQPLRMDEREDYTWCAPRLATWAARWNRPTQLNELPHPLI